MSNWTNPYFGIQHLKPLSRGFQITVTDWGSFAECSVFVPGCGFSATDTKHETIEAARAHGEQQAQMLRAFANAA